MNYSKALGVIRAAKQLQQKDLADILDVSASYISKVEKGERPLTPQLIDKLCKELSVPKQLFMLLGNDSSKLNNESRKTVDSLGRELLDIIIAGNHRESVR